jgi:cyclophilin family peptidyl-prolyl cis-trans isomerase
LSVPDQPDRALRHVVECLENRILLSKVHPAHIASDYLDNRGQAFFTVSVALDTSTLSRKTAAIFTAGDDGVLGSADDQRVYTAVGYRKGRLTLRANLALNEPYRVKLNASVIKDVNGRALDGEFKGDLKASGDGVAGGDYDVITQKARKTKFRFTTVAGFINVSLYTKNARATSSNFMHYANEGAWDATFFHRSEQHTQSGGLDVIQAGGYDVANGTIGSVHSNAGVGLELGNSNVQGTLAMARADNDTHSNTNQWFFNTKDNTVLDTLNGGYTVFGTVLDSASLKTIAAVNRLAVRDARAGDMSNPFGELPVVDPAAGSTRQIAAPDDLVMISRVAQLYAVVATPGKAKPATVVAMVRVRRADGVLVLNDDENSVLWS